MKILHTADLHYRPADADKALASLEALRTAAIFEHVDLIAFAGDLFDRAILNSEQARLPDLLQMFESLLHACPIVAVRGTPSHDVAGCYEPIVQLRGLHSFTLLEPGRAYVFSGHDDEVHDLADLTEAEQVSAKMLILGTGEPSKEWFLADKNGLGREQAAEAVVGGMRQLLLGLGAIRKEHADLPCLMVYHGQVAGATMANGQALRPGGIQIGREDLALVGADYYALGDIHLAQQIGDLPAYYADSAYPNNWGELKRKGCWLVELSGPGQPPAMSRVDFPHPPRRKLIAEWGADIAPLDVAGQQVWAVVKRSEPLEGNMAEHEDVILGHLLANGALPGSRVTIDIERTETVRAGEIAEAQSLGDKLQVYAENSSEQIPPGTAGRVEQLEAEARSSGSLAAGQHIRIDSLRLRGAIGVWKGQGVDEISLDLAAYDDGLVALLGPNGAGKTTLIENLHPFPSLLTRDGKLQDHFRLRDSYRDLTWTDLRTGYVYRSLIAIDAQAACDYHLYRNGEPLVNGRKADYEARIADLWGSLPLYQRSAFVTQRPSKSAPELSDATKGERKALFRELGGLDYLQDYADRAKAHRSDIEGKLIADQREIEVLARESEEPADRQATLDTLRAASVAARQVVETIEAQGKDARTDADKAQARLTSHRAAEVEANGLRNQVVQLGHERAGLEQRIVACRKAEEQRPAIETNIRNYETLKTEEESLNAKRTDVLLERERITAVHNRALEAHRSEQRKVESRQQELKDQAATLSREKVREMAAVDALCARLATVTCPHCGGAFALGGETDKAALEAKQQRVLDLDCDLVLNEKHQKDAAAELAALVAPAAPELPVYDDTALKAVADELRQYNIASLRKALDQATTAGAQIDAAEAAITTAGQKLLGLQVKIKAAESRLDPTAEADQAAAQKLVDDLSAAWKKARGDATAAEAEVKAIEAAMAEAARKRALLAEVKARAAAAETDAAGWRWLERACGPDGIQALELDAMGPGIAAVANRILEAAYGSRFAIEFRTTRLGGKGARTKQIEDFQIIVRDSERGGEQPIETLSGGESVWIKRALYDAFGIIRDRATGQRFLTVFQDEADGALDPEARAAYFAMLEAAHHEAGRRHTIVITHSPEAQESIPQRIDMRDLARVGVPA